MSAATMVELFMVRLLFSCVRIRKKRIKKGPSSYANTARLRLGGPVRRRTLLSLFGQLFRRIFHPTGVKRARDRRSPALPCPSCPCAKRKKTSRKQERNEGSALPGQDRQAAQPAVLPGAAVPRPVGAARGGNKQRQQHHGAHKHRQDAAKSFHGPLSPFRPSKESANLLLWYLRRGFSIRKM